jgi:hypothetical protein
MQLAEERKLSVAGVLNLRPNVRSLAGWASE